MMPAVNGGTVNDQAVWTWISAGGLTVEAAFKFDSLSMIMALIVTGVSLLIHIYAAGYMNHEDQRGFSRFFAYLNLFVFSMLILVMGNSFLLMFVGWEGVGLCSYLLIGFWYDRERKEGDSTWPAEAAKKAFIVNRIGDFGFLIGMFILIATFGSLNFDAVFAAAAGRAGRPALLGSNAALVGMPGAVFWARSASRRRYRSISGSPTPCKVRRRSARSSMPRRWSPRASIWSRARMSCSICPA